jgi:hypothetical protein
MKRFHLRGFVQTSHALAEQWGVDIGFLPIICLVPTLILISFLATLLV